MRPKSSAPDARTWGSVNRPDFAGGSSILETMAMTRIYLKIHVEALTDYT